MASNNNGGRNRALITDAREALNRMKIEVANEIGLRDYDKVDKGNLTSRQNGYVGGNMTKKMVALAEQVMANGGSTGSTAAQVASTVPAEQIEGSQYRS